MKRIIAGLAALVMGAGFAVGCCEEDSIWYYKGCKLANKNATSEGVTEIVRSPEDKGSAGVIESTAPSECSWTDRIKEYQVFHRQSYDHVDFVVQFKAENMVGSYSEYAKNVTFDLKDATAKFDFSYSIDSEKQEKFNNRRIQEWAASQWTSAPTLPDEVSLKKARRLMECFKDKGNIGTIRKQAQEFYKTE